MGGRPGDGRLMELKRSELEITFWRTALGELSSFLGIRLPFSVTFGFVSAVFKIEELVVTVVVLIVFPVAPIDTLVE